MPERTTQEQCDFYIVDVFTNKPLTGNPLCDSRTVQYNYFY